MTGMKELRAESCKDSKVEEGEAESEGEGEEESEVSGKDVAVENN